VELATTAGSGVVIFALAGVFLIVVSALGYTGRKRQRGQGGSPRSKKKRR